MSSASGPHPPVGTMANTWLATRPHSHVFMGPGFCDRGQKAHTASRTSLASAVTGTPSRTSRWTMALPTPPVAPATTAFRPLNLRGSGTARLSSAQGDNTAANCQAAIIPRCCDASLNAC